MRISKINQMVRVVGKAATYWINTMGVPRHIEIQCDRDIPTLCVKRFDLDRYEDEHGPLTKGQSIPLEAIGYWYGSLYSTGEYQNPEI